MTYEWAIWSNEHNGFWKPNRHGYTRSLAEAGRFSKEEAQRICDEASLGGRLTFETETGHKLPPEIMLYAPPARRATASAEELAAHAVYEFAEGKRYPGSDRLTSIFASVIKFDRENRS